MDENRERPKLNWETVRDFERDGLVIRVQKCGYRYSVQVGLIPKNTAEITRLIPFLPVRVEGTKSLTAKLKLERNWAIDLNELMEAALGYIIECEEYHRARHIDDAIVKDEVAVARSKPKTRRTGKTERTREKKRARLRT